MFYTAYYQNISNTGHHTVTTIDLMITYYYQVYGNNLKNQFPTSLLSVISIHYWSTIYIAVM